MLDAIQKIDEIIMLFIQENVRCGFLDVIMKFFSIIGNAGIIWILLAIGLMITKKYRTLGFNILLAVAVCYCINDIIIKNIIARDRPFLAVEGLQAIVARPSSYSFPSGHTCSSFAAAYVITKETHGKWACIYILAALIGLSRPYVGVHYVSDIIVGAAVGTVGSWLTLKLRYRLTPNKIGDKKA